MHMMSGICHIFNPEISLYFNGLHCVYALDYYSLCYIMLLYITIGLLHQFYYNTTLPYTK